MADIFISYAKEDKSRAEPLAKVLEGQGWSVWWDRKIPPGKTFAQVIEEAITAAKCVIVLWSVKSVKSDWVQNEAAEGASRKILVPALIDDVPIPFEFRRIQAADLIDWKAQTDHPGYTILLSAISEIVGPSPLKVKEAERKHEEEERGRKQEEERQRKDEEQQREEVKREEAEEKRKAAAEKGAWYQPDIEPQQKHIPYKKLTRFQSIPLQILIGAILGAILTVIAGLLVRTFHDIAIAGLVGATGWAVIVVISGFDTRAIEFLIIGFFVAAIMWKIFDVDPYSNISYARALYYGGGIGALMGSIAGRIFSKYKKAN